LNHAVFPLTLLSSNQATVLWSLKYISGNHLLIFVRYPYLFSCLFVRIRLQSSDLIQTLSQAVFSLTLLSNNQATVLWSFKYISGNHPLIFCSGSLSFSRVYYVRIRLQSSDLIYILKFQLLILLYNIVIRASFLDMEIKIRLMSSDFLYVPVRLPMYWIHYTQQ
jgi:hypothetical protein